MGSDNGLRMVSGSVVQWSTIRIWAYREPIDGTVCNEVQLGYDGFDTSEVKW